MKKIVIVVGEKNSLFGTGHWRRMSFFVQFLKQSFPSIVISIQGIPTNENTSILSHLAQKYKEVDLFLIDARDLDVKIFSRIAPIITLDNRHIHRSRWLKTHAVNTPSSLQKIICYDTLYYPKTSSEIFTRSLLNPLVIAAKKKQQSLINLSKTKNLHNVKYREKKIALVYAPLPSSVPLNKQENSILLFQLLQTLLKEKCIQKVHWFNSQENIPLTQETSHPNILYYENTDDHSFFLDKMLKASFFFSYFGLSVIEAIYLSTAPILIPGFHKEHATLSAAISQEYGIPYLNFKSPILQYKKQFSEIKIPKIKIGEQGYFLLSKEIEKFLYNK